MWISFRPVCPQGRPAAEIRFSGATFSATTLAAPARSRSADRRPDPMPSLAARHDSQRDALAELTGWSLEDVGRRMATGVVPRGEGLPVLGAALAVALAL